MKVGIVSDLHCNIAGLERAVALMGPVDDLLCLGDSIYEYRFSNEVAAFLRDRGAKTILGNHEEVFFGAGGERARQAEWIDPDLMARLAAEPR
ncbi:MAG: metallophosphoesterase family protein, partial [Alphaproteobacteria bacterium]|nr:metallophosphoesterase family protein [Alphaproteobacteria bacterium]